MARTTKPQMYDNLYERVKWKSFSNPDIMAITELEKVKTLSEESEEVKDAMCILIESALFNNNYCKNEIEKYQSILIKAGYVKNDD